MLGQLPPGTHVLVMTHDHAEDFALCDAALRCEHLGAIGLIGSAAKWARFREGAARRGAPRGSRSTRIRCPIGDPAIARQGARRDRSRVAAEVLRMAAAERVARR